MIDDDLLSGENVNNEYKREVPEKSIKYVNTSPGGLPSGLTVERMKAGYSIVRNEALANVFLYMRLFEHFGSGIPRVIEMVKSYGLPEPEYVDMEAGIRVNFIALLKKLSKRLEKPLHKMLHKLPPKLPQKLIQLIIKMLI